MRRSSDSAPTVLTPDTLDWNERDYQSLRRDIGDSRENGKISLILSADSAQSLSQMSAACKKSGSGTSELPLVNGLTTRVDSRHLKSFLTTLPGGTTVNADRPLAKNPEHIFQEAPEVDTAVTPTSGGQLAGVSKLWDQGYKGKGQTVAVIDSGMFPHPDLKNRLTVWKDFSEDKPKPVDPFGHSTNVEGIIVGDGTKSGGKVMGVAPEANLASLRIGSVGDAIKALQWVIDNKDAQNITVVNLSLGDKATKPWAQDPWAQAVQKVIDAGIVVVAAAGNNGPISTPGILPDVITVGAVDSKGTGDPNDDVLAPFTGKGQIVDGVQKPDLLAPGVGIYGPLSPDSAIDKNSLPHIKKDYIALSGTSQAAPQVAGLCLLLRQARPDLTPAQIHQVLLKSAYHYSNIADVDQGAGLVQADKAMELALAMPRADVAQA